MLGLRRSNVSAGLLQWASDHLVQASMSAQIVRAQANA